MVIDGTAGILLLLGRLLFGVVLAFMGLNHFMDTDQMTGYAEHKGVPAPKASVLLSGAMLVLGGLGIAAGVYPVLSGALLVVFHIASAFMMHDFWSVPEEQTQDEMTQFLKNMTMTGAALTFMAIGGQEWAYAVDVGLGLF